MKRPTEMDVRAPLGADRAWDAYHLRLFFSADVVGSTAFKQKPEGETNGSGGVDPAWFGMVLSFYHQAEKAFAQNWEKYERQFSEDNDESSWFGDAPEVWKTVGDEVLFTKIVTHPMQAVMALHAWCQTLDDLRVQLRSKFGLDVKSCVWLADFPLRNQEVVLGHTKAGDDDDYTVLNRNGLAAFYSDERASQNMLRDFIGPAIDTGFRLGSFASPRKLIISLELAHLLSIEQAYAESNPGWHSKGPSEIRKFVFRYDGKHALKGVLGGHPYPVFWIDLDTESALNRAEDALIRSGHPTSHAIKAFTTAMLEEYPRYLAKPCFERQNGGSLVAPDHACIDDDIVSKMKDREAYFQMLDAKSEREESDIADPTDMTVSRRTDDIDQMKDAIRRLVESLRDPGSGHSKRGPDSL